MRGYVFALLFALVVTGLFYILFENDFEEQPTFTPLSVEEDSSKITATARGGHPWNHRVHKRQILQAARQVARQSSIAPKYLVAVMEQETRLGKNLGRKGILIQSSQSVWDQIGAEMYASLFKTQSPDAIPSSNKGAIGLTQVRPEMLLRHCGIRVDFGDTPTFLLHGTERYRNMWREERTRGVKKVQRLLGIQADGLVGPATLAKVQQVTGERYFTAAAKYKLIKRFFWDQVQITLNPGKDKVFKRICEVQGLDPSSVDYFLPNLWDPLHAMAYTSIHMEDDMRRARRGIKFGLAAYFSGYGGAKKGHGRRYQRSVLAKAKKYASL